MHNPFGMVEKERKKRTDGRWYYIISYPLSLCAALRRNGSNSNNFQTLIIEYIKEEEKKSDSCNYSRAKEREEDWHGGNCPHDIRRAGVREKPCFDRFLIYKKKKKTKITFRHSI
jgi:hypothetical protein